MSEYVRITDRKIELTDEGVEAFMSDYIPTTEEVRELVQGASAEEFDRWLAEVKAQAWQDGWHAKDTDVNPYRQGEEQ